MNVQEEYTALNMSGKNRLQEVVSHVIKVTIYLIRRIWWTHDGCLPVKEIIANRPSRALELKFYNMLRNDYVIDYDVTYLGRWIPSDILKFLIDSLQSHFMVRGKCVE